jgi:hypothetical protein
MRHSRPVLRPRDGGSGRRMARNAGHFPHLLTIDLRDQTGWLGREDSNLRMAESKSDHFPFEVNAHSEKFTKFDPLSIKSLATNTEYRTAR